MVNQDKGNSAKIQLFQVLGVLLEYRKIKQHDRRKKSILRQKLLKKNWSFKII